MTDRDEYGRFESDAHRPGEERGTRKRATDRNERGERDRLDSDPLRGPSDPDRDDQDAYGRFEGSSTRERGDERDGYGRFESQAPERRSHRDDEDDGRSSRSAGRSSPRSR